MSEAAAPETGMPTHGAFCWSELATNNLEACRAFYKNVFGWTMDPSKNAGVGGMEYQEFSRVPGEYPMGGMYDMKHIFGDNAPPPHWVNYIAVDDVDAAAARVVALGGECCHPAKEIPNVGRMVTIKDPTGAVVILLTLKQA